MEAMQVSKKRNIIGWIATGFISAMLLFSAFNKIMSHGDPDAMMSQNFVRWGLEGRLILIAIGELTTALLFLIPRTSSLGILLISAYLGGAIATHLEHDEMRMMFVPAILMVIAWIVITCASRKCWQALTKAINPCSSFDGTK